MQTTKFNYTLKYNRSVKLWLVLIDGSTHVIQKLKSGKYCIIDEVKLTLTLRDAVYLVLSKYGVI